MTPCPHQIRRALSSHDRDSFLAGVQFVIDNHRRERDGLEELILDVRAEVAIERVNQQMAVPA